MIVVEHRCALGHGLDLLFGERRQAGARVEDGCGEGEIEARIALDNVGGLDEFVHADRLQRGRRGGQTSTNNWTHVNK